MKKNDRQDNKQAAGKLANAEIGESEKINFGIIAAIFFIAVTTIFPLFMTRMGYNSITKEKAHFFISLTMFITFGGIIALIITAKRFRPISYIVKSFRKQPFTVPEWALMVFLLLTLISSFLSPWKDFVWDGFTMNGQQGRWEGFWAFLAYGLAFFIIAWFYRPERLHLIIFAGGSILLTMFGILEFLGLDLLYGSKYVIVEIDEPFPPMTRVFRTTLGNINIVSAYCSLVIILFAALFVGEKSKWCVIYIIASALAFQMLIISDGDAGKVGIFGALLLFLPHLLSDR